MNIKGIDLCMSDEERLLVEKYITLTKENVNDISMLEWGSGGSTLYFSDMVSEYFSIEHDDNWYKKIDSLKNDNVNYNFVPLHPQKFDDDLDAVADVIWNDWGGEKRKKDGIIYRTLRGPTKDWHETIDYIKKPLSFDRDKFELVLVDGRARPMCAFMATKLMDRDSYLLFHDFGYRPYYYGVLRYFKPIERAGSLVVFKLRDNPVSNEEILKKYNTRAIGWAEKRKKLSTDFMCKLTEHTYLEMEKELEGDK